MQNWLALTLGGADPPAQAVSDAAFAFWEPSRPGTLRTAPDAFSGHVAVPDFWTTSCSVCFRKFPELDAFRERYADDPRVSVFSVNLTTDGDTTGQAEAMMDRYDYGFPTLYADLSLSEAEALYGFRGVPAVVVYRPDGTVASVGPATFDPLVLVGNVGRAVGGALRQGGWSSAGEISEGPTGYSDYD